MKVMASKCFLSVSSFLADPTDSVLVKLVLSLLQLCKLAANHPGGADILGKNKNQVTFTETLKFCCPPCQQFDKF